MKPKIKCLINSILILFIFVSCEKDFLERYPLDGLNDATYFSSSNDLKMFVNAFYRMFPRYDVGIGVDAGAGMDIYVSDDGASNFGPNTALMQHNSTGQASDSDGDWNWYYGWIREINYLIENSSRVNPVDVQVDQYTGEAYFFRALTYFKLLSQYGDVPYITKVLNTNDDELYRPRDPRHDVAKWIIQDLDSAINKLSWKGIGPAGSGRINKETAIVMKARVALFEGTWERYHSRKGSIYAVAGKNGTDFLEIVPPTIKTLIDKCGTNISRIGGPLNEPYNQIFSQQDASQTPGVFFYTIYDKSLLGFGHNFFDRVVEGASYTDHLIRLYLDKNGNPQPISILDVDDKDLLTLGESLDPRFRQTIWTPDKGPMNQLSGYKGFTGGFFIKASRYPFITKFQEHNFSATGYRNWKGAILDYNEWRNGSTDDVLIRYAEGLLAYAEAKAILGTITQNDIDITINILRSRVDMAPMNLSVVNSWDVSVYPSDLGFDPNETNIVNEIRRERSIELVNEGFRFDDLRRWAVFENVINGYKPKGAYAQQFMDYYNNAEKLVADGYKLEEATTLKLIKENKFDTFEDGYLNPFYLYPEFQSGGTGYYINPQRSYLRSIPKSEIDLYLEKGGVVLTQNPGWF